MEERNALVVIQKQDLVLKINVLEVCMMNTDDECVKYIVVRFVPLVIDHNPGYKL